MSLSETTWESLRPTGFGPEDRPDDGGVPRLPSDVTDLAEEDVIVLYTAFVEWTNYAASQMSDAWDAEKQLQFELDSALADAAVLARQEKTVTAQKAVAAADPAAREAARQLLYAGARRRKLETVYANCERRAQLLSRELSRRIARRDRDVRHTKWSGA